MVPSPRHRPVTAAGLLLVLWLLAPAAALPVTAAPGASLALVGQEFLGHRGMNAALALADHCAFVGSRNDAAPQVVDVSAPSRPAVVGALPAHPGSTPREIRTVPALHEVAVLSYGLNGGYNAIDVLRWNADCTRPVVVGTYNFGGAAPHEFYLWQDAARPARVLLYVAMFAASPQELQVVDISDPAQPVLAGTWAVPSSYGHAPLHSVALSGDGRTAYLSLWTGGLVVGDVSDFAAGRAHPVLRPLTLAGATYRTDPGDVHSAVPLAAAGRVLTTDERYPAPFGQGCPFGTAHVVDVSDPAHPRALSTMSVPENTPGACAAAARGTWTSHNPTLTANLAFISWYSAGLEVFQLDNPAQPLRLAEFRPGASSPAQRDLQLGTTDAMTWSYPVIRNGLVYVVDINQGLLVLRYSGPHQDEVAGAALIEGNSNAGAAVALTPTVPAALATPAAPRTPSPPGLGVSRTLLAVVALLFAVSVAALIYGRSRPHSDL